MLSSLYNVVEGKRLKVGVMLGLEGARWEDLEEICSQMSYLPIIA